MAGVALSTKSLTNAKLMTPSVAGMAGNTTGPPCVSPVPLHIHPWGTGAPSTSISETTVVSRKTIISGPTMSSFYRFYDISILMMFTEAMNAFASSRKLLETLLLAKIDGNVEDYIRRCHVCNKAKSPCSLSNCLSARFPKACNKRLEQTSLSGMANYGSLLVIISANTHSSLKPNYFLKVAF